MSPVSNSLTESSLASEMETLADHNLLLRIGVRDERALAALYDRYSGLVYTLALRIVGDRDLAQEVLQDVFWQCWQGAGQYDQTRGRVAAWLMGIARNRAVDLLRSRQHQARLREGEALALPDDRGRLVQQDSSEAVLLRQVVRDALTALPTAQRQTIELAYYDGLTQAEIAQKMEAPLGTVKTRMRDALERLRHRLRPLIEPASVDKENR